MNYEQRMKMFRDVFAPKSGERILFLVDVPHDNIKNSEAWEDRREMAREWYDAFKKMGAEVGFSARWLEYEATGLHNSPIPPRILDAVRNSNLVIAMTECSASSSLRPMCFAPGTITRCASMPLVERRMEETSLGADYAEVQKYAIALGKILDDAIGAEIVFSTRDELYVDLRYREADVDKGECTKTGQFINFPSGEAWKVPYEAVSEEINEFGKSGTEGILPASYGGELVKYAIKNNRIVQISGEGKQAGKMRSLFAENETRRNIAELGIGCNPKAVVTGNALEDEKAGLHIAYGMSTYLGGKVKSDMHIDIVFAKGCPVEAEIVTLTNINRSRTEIVRASTVRYDLLKR